jgi:hypothetical protein
MWIISQSAVQAKEQVNYNTVNLYNKIQNVYKFFMEKIIYTVLSHCNRGREN